MKDDLDDVFVAGVLHDLGLIVVTDLHPDLQEKIRLFCKDKEIPLKLLENFSYGLNHADLGGLIASKWNFPEQLVEGIRLHHDPLAARVPHNRMIRLLYNPVISLSRLRESSGSVKEKQSRIQSALATVSTCRSDSLRGCLPFLFTRPPKCHYLPHVPGKLAAKFILQKVHRLAQSFEIDIRTHANSLEHMNRVLGGEVAGGTFDKRAAAQSPHAGIEDTNAGFEACEHVGHCHTPRIVQVQRNAGIREVVAGLSHKTPNGDRVGHAGGIGQVDFRGAGLNHGLH